MPRQKVSSTNRVPQTLRAGYFQVAAILVGMAGLGLVSLCAVLVAAAVEDPARDFSAPLWSAAVAVGMWMAAALLFGVARRLDVAVTPEEQIEWDRARRGVRGQAPSECPVLAEAPPLSRERWTAARVAAQPARYGMSLLTRLPAGAPSVANEGVVVWERSPYSGGTVHLYGEDVQPDDYVEDDLEDVDISALPLLRPWTARADDAKAGGAFLSPPMVKALNSIGDGAVVVSFSGGWVSLWALGHVDAERMARLQRWQAILVKCHHKGEGLRSAGDAPGSEARDSAVEDARIGVLPEHSLVRKRWKLVSLMVAVVGLTFLPGMMFWWRAAVPESAHFNSTAVWFVVLAIGPLAAAYYGSSRMEKRIEERQLTVARQMHQVAQKRNARYDVTAVLVGGTWTTPPFSHVTRLSIGPQVKDLSGPSAVCAAWMEGDYGPTLLPLRAFTSRVAWADLPRPLPPVDLVPERFSDALAKLVGGQDVDVESYDFNRRWRVKATSERDAHAMLQPRMIALLNSVDDPRVAFHVDGSRVVIWDDGKDDDVDLGARIDLLGQFVDCLPHHLRSPGEESA